jgi:DNA-binding transcriptional regulator LsrR (DeoR family)
VTKKHSTQERIRAKVVKIQAQKERRLKRNDDESNGEHLLDRTEVISLVCKYFCQGKTVAQIKEIMADKHGIKLSREQPYKMLSRAATRGWLIFQAPLDHILTERLGNEYGSLDGIQVVHSASSEDLAHHGAREILRFLRKYKEGAQQRDEVHIGFAGGPTMRKLARHLANLLCQPQVGMPARIHLHALVSGFNPHDPTTDPNAFFTYFVRRPGLPSEIKFVGLHAPALVKTEDFPSLKRMTGIKEAYEAREKIDIFVTAGADWEDDHSLFKTCMKRSETAFAQLEAAGCVGDLLWQPIGERNPITEKTDIRAMTLVELSELPKFIASGKEVMLLLGSCGGCDRPKGRLLRSILSQGRQLITHLVTDSRTASQALDGLEERADQAS